MPKLEPKLVQKELEKGLIWPVYWIYGAEKMKLRELVKRIRKAVLGDSAAEASGSFGSAEEFLDATEINGNALRESLLSPTLGGGVRFVSVRDAQALKDSEALGDLMGPAQSMGQIREKLNFVCVLLAKDLDGRKKFTKILLEKAAVVPCDEVPEAEREAWIHYLSKRRGLTLDGSAVAQLSALDPWSLDIIDQELEKYALASLYPTKEAGASDAQSVFLPAGSVAGNTDQFLDAFFTRNLRKSLLAVGEFADRPEVSLPLLGLLAWNVRQLVLGKSQKLNPILADRLNRWSGHWTLTDLTNLQSRLAELDWNLKQTPLLPLGVWDSLVLAFGIESASTPSEEG